MSDQVSLDLLDHGHTTMIRCDVASKFAPGFPKHWIMIKLTLLFLPLAPWFRVGKLTRLLEGNDDIRWIWRDPFIR